MQIDFKNTLEKHLSTGINFFAGAGFSLLAKDISGRALPVGDDLKKELLEIFSGMPSVLDLPRLCTMISQTDKSKLYEYLYSRFTIGNYNDLYKSLHAVEIKNLFTTNIDNLFHRIYEDCSHKYVNDVNLRGASFRDKQAIDFYYMHGSVLDKDAPLIFGDLDIASAFSSDPSRWNFLTSQMGRFPTLFWGYALRDAGTLQAFAQALKQHNQKDAWIIVHADHVLDGEIEFYKSIGLKIIKSDTESFLSYLHDFGTIDKNPTTATTVSKTPFPEYAVPSNANIKHRATQSFFQGATPEWSDVYSPRRSQQGRW